MENHIVGAADLNNSSTDHAVRCVTFSYSRSRWSSSRKEIRARNVHSGMVYVTLTSLHACCCKFANNEAQVSLNFVTLTMCTNLLLDYGFSYQSILSPVSYAHLPANRDRNQSLSTNAPLGPEEWN